MEEATVVVEDDSPAEVVSTPGTLRNLSAWAISIPYVDFFEDEAKREKIPVFCIEVERNDRKEGKCLIWGAFPSAYCMWDSLYCIGDLQITSEFSFLVLAYVAVASRKNGIFCLIFSSNSFQWGMRRNPGYSTEDILNSMSLSPNSQSFTVCYLFKFILNQLAVNQYCCSYNK